MNTRLDTNSRYGTYNDYWSPTDYREYLLSMMHGASRDTRYRRYIESPWTARYDSISPENNYEYPMRPYRPKDIEGEVDSSKIDEFLGNFKVKD